MKKILAIFALIFALFVGSVNAQSLKLKNLSDENADYPKGLSAAFSLEGRNTFLLGNKEQVMKDYNPLDGNTYNVGILTGRLLVGKRYGLLLNARVDNAATNLEQKEEVQGYIGFGLTAYVVKDAFRLDAFAGPTFKKSELNGRSTSFFGGVGIWFGGSKLPSIEGIADIIFNNDGCKYIYGKFVYEINDFLNIGFVSEKNMGRNLRVGPVLEIKTIATDFLNFKITGGLTAGSEEVWNAFFGIRANIHTR